MDIYHVHFLWNYPQGNAARPHLWLVKIGSYYGLVPSRKKPLPEPMVTKFFAAIMMSLSHNSVRLSGDKSQTTKPEPTIIIILGWSFRRLDDTIHTVDDISMGISASCLNVIIIIYQIVAAFLYFVSGIFLPTKKSTKVCNADPLCGKQRATEINLWSVMCLKILSYFTLKLICDSGVLVSETSKKRSMSGFNSLFSLLLA